MSIKQQHASDIKFYWDGRDGNLTDKSGNVADGSFVNNPVWQNSGKGKALFFDGATVGAKYVTFPARAIGDAITGSTAITIGIWFKPNGASGDVNPSMLNTHIAGAGQSGISFRAANLTATNYQVLVGGRSQSGDTFRSHTTTKTYKFHEWAFAMAVIDYTNNLVSIDVNGSPEGSTAGIFGGNTYTQSSTSGAKDSLAVKEGLGPILSLEYGGEIREVIIFDVGLSSAERTQYYEESLQEGFIGGLAKRNFQLPEVQIDQDANLRMGYNMKINRASLVDISPNNNVPTAMTGVSDTEGLFGRAVEMRGAGSIQLPTLFASDPSEFTISTWIKSSDITNEQRLYAYNDDGHYALIRLNNTTSGRIGVLVYDGASQEVTTDAYNFSESTHIVLTAKNSDFATLYVNSTKIGDIALGTMSEVSTVGRYIGTGRSGSGQETTGVFESFQVLNAKKDQEWVNAEYAKGARKIFYNNDFRDEPITVASSISSGYISDGVIDSGTWKISYDGTYKWLECVTSGKWKTPLGNADVLTTDTFTISGTPTLTKTSAHLEIDALAGEKVRSLIITL